MGNSKGCFLIYLLLLLLLPNFLAVKRVVDSRIYELHVPVVLNLNSSTLGAILQECMSMAISDYYTSHPDHRTRLRLHIKNDDSLIDADFAVPDLLNHEDKLMTQLGERILSPIIFLHARGSSGSYPDNRYYIKATPEDTIQTKAIAAVCQDYGWPEVSVIYEDTKNGNRFVSYFTKALQEVKIGLACRLAFSTSVEDGDILKELKRLTTKQNRVFVVDMNPALGSRLFEIAKRAGLISKGYAWIISESLSNMMNSATRDSMQGVLGVRPYVYRSDKLDKFQTRLKSNILLKNMTISSMELNVHYLWAYDAVTALATAAERIRSVDYARTTKTKKDISNLDVSIVNSRLLKELARTKFRGLSGEFELVDRKLKQSTFEVFNVHGSGEKVLGYWTPGKGIVQKLNAKSRNRLKNVMWPGECTSKPNGWFIPCTEKIRAGLSWAHRSANLKSTTVFGKNHSGATGLGTEILVAAVRVPQLTYQLSADSLI